jgi:alanine racemase
VSAAAPVASIPSDMKSSFHRPCWVEISTQALRSNWRTLKSKISKGTQMLAVVKANGYGLGLLNVSKIAVEEGAAYLGVSSVEEGIMLRDAGFTIPVLILGSLYPFESFSLLFQYKLTPTIASLEAAEALDRLAADRHVKLPIHLKIDSGFGRIGVSISSAGDFIRQVAAKPGLLIEGIYTHFASSDVDEDYTHDQTDAFLSVVKAAGDLFPGDRRPRWIHMANSSALLRFPETHGTLVRPGLAFYGVPPYPRSQNVVPLTPVLTWKSKVIFLKMVPEDTGISYARTWIAKRPTRVATLAAGYADGLPRLLSNKGQVLIGGRRCPILGRVTMDMTMVDVTDLTSGGGGCRIGDEVVLIGRQGAEEITAGEMADWAQTNAYEILCGIGARVPRVMIDA